MPRGCARLRTSQHQTDTSAGSVFPCVFCSMCLFPMQMEAVHGRYADLPRHHKNSETETATLYANHERYANAGKNVGHMHVCVQDNPLNEKNLPHHKLVSLRNTSCLFVACSKMILIIDQYLCDSLIKGFDEVLRQVHV